MNLRGWQCLPFNMKSRITTIMCSLTSVANSHLGNPCRFGGGPWRERGEEFGGKEAAQQRCDSRQPTL